MSKFTDISEYKALTRTSTFSLTINTNQSVKGKDEFKQIGEEKLRSYLSGLSQNFEEYLRPHKRWKDENGETVYTPLDLTPSETGELITDGSLDHSIEVGDKFHRLHAHTSIVIVHDEDINFFINTDRIRAELPPGTHVMARYIPDASYGWKKYNRKGK